MGAAKRYEKRELNIKKVLGTVIVLALMIIFVIYIISEANDQKNKNVLTTTKYFTLFKDNLYGVIDECGNQVVSPFYKEMIIIPNKAKDVFLITYDVDYDLGTYKTKAINKENEAILTQFEKIEPIIYSSTSNVTYNDEVLKFSKDNLYGLTNLDGTIIQDAKYEKIVEIPNTAKYLKTLKDGKFGIVDTSGKQIIDNIYDNIDILDNLDGFVVTNNLSGISNLYGEVILPLEYEKVSTKSTKDIFVVGENETLKLIDKNNEELDSSGVYEVKEIGRNIIFKSKDGTYGVKSQDGQNILDAKYQDVKSAFQDNFIVKQNNLYGLIDKEQNVLIDFKYSKINYNKDKDIYICDIDEIQSDIYDKNYENKLNGIVLEVQDDYIKLNKLGETKYYNFQFEQIDENIFFNNTLTPKKENSKYGFINKKQEQVVDYLYDDIAVQNEFGYIGVKKDGLWGVINKDGKLLIDTIYNLDEYLNIDFIGKYHRGIDSSIEYYTDEDK